MKLRKSLRDTCRYGPLEKTRNLDTFQGKSHKEEHHDKENEDVADQADVEEGLSYEDNGILRRSLLRDELQEKQGR